MSVAHSVRMIGELGQPPRVCLFGWFSFGYISPKSKVLCDPYSLGSDITKKKEKRMAARILGPQAARKVSPAAAMRAISWQERPAVHNAMIPSELG